MSPRGAVHFCAKQEWIAGRDWILLRGYPMANRRISHLEACRVVNGVAISAPVSTTTSPCDPARKKDVQSSRTGLCRKQLGPGDSRLFRLIASRRGVREDLRMDVPDFRNARHLQRAWRDRWAPAAQRLYQTAGEIRLIDAVGSDYSPASWISAACVPRSYADIEKMFPTRSRGRSRGVVATEE